MQEKQIRKITKRNQVRLHKISDGRAGSDRKTPKMKGPCTQYSAEYFIQVPFISADFPSEICLFPEPEIMCLEVSSFIILLDFLITEHLLLLVLVS